MVFTLTKCHSCVTMSAIKIAHNPVQHNKIKHIEIHHHFIRDHVNQGEINLSYVGTQDQLADIFMKPLDEAIFRELRHELNIIDSLQCGLIGCTNSHFIACVLI
jgi:hypothetical protein